MGERGVDLLLRLRLARKSFTAPRGIFFCFERAKLACFWPRHAFETDSCSMEPTRLTRLQAARSKGESREASRRTTTELPRASSVIANGGCDAIDKC